MPLEKEEKHKVDDAVTVDKKRDSNNEQSKLSADGSKDENRESKSRL